MNASAIRLSWRLLAIGASIAALLLAGFAVGLITREVVAQADNDTINACVGDRSGSVRIVAGPGDCLRGESPLAWTQQGANGYAYAEQRVTLNVGEATFRNIACPVGKRVITGGIVGLDGNFLNLDVIYEGPVNNGGTWQVLARNSGVVVEPISFTITTVCATFPS